MTLLRWHIRPLDFRPDRAYPGAPEPITATHKGEALLIAKLRHGPDVTVIADIAMREVVADFSRWHKDLPRIGDKPRKKRVRNASRVTSRVLPSMMVRDCLRCGLPFDTLESRPSRFCSQACRTSHHRHDGPLPTQTCPCGRPMRRNANGTFLEACGQCRQARRRATERQTRTTCACGKPVRINKHGNRYRTCQPCYHQVQLRAARVRVLAIRQRRAAA